MTCGTPPHLDFFNHNNLHYEALFAQDADLDKFTIKPAMMALPMRLSRALQPISTARQALRSQPSLWQGSGRKSLTSSSSYRQSSRQPVRNAISSPQQQNEALSSPQRRASNRAFTASARQLKTKRAHNNEEVPDNPPTTDFSRMDMLSQAPAPSTSIDICSSDGFKLNSGVSIYDGKGVVLLGGEAFEWQPWGPDLRLVNAKGQWEVPEGAFGMFDLVWPRPGMSCLYQPYFCRVATSITAYMFCDAL